MNRRWTEEEKTLLADTYEENTSETVAGYLNRTPKAVRNMASIMGVRALKRSHSFPREAREYFPSSDLAYLIGAIMGDGYVHTYVQKKPRVHVHRYIKLRVKDFEFAHRAKEAFSKVRGRTSKIYTVYNHHTTISAGTKMFIVQVEDKDLYNLLNQPLKELKPYIEAYPREFLRGFFDAEGSAWIIDRKNKRKRVIHNGREHFVNRRSVEPVVSFGNTDKGLLEYVRELLTRLGIFPAPKLGKSKGNFGKNPKICYNLHIYRKASVERFMRLVGSSIPRKNLVV